MLDLIFNSNLLSQVTFLVLQNVLSKNRLHTDDFILPKIIK